MSPSAAHASQLWAKGLPLDAAVHRFTVGGDPVTDLVFVPFDAVGSAAHALTLLRGGLLTRDDAVALLHALQGIAAKARTGCFAIRPEQEDGHTAIEAALIAACGEIGKKIHLGRSRNDQVILATRLYLRHELLSLGERLCACAEAFLSFARRHGAIPMPGYTHLRRAMPSNLGQWSGAFAEGLLEELEALEAVYRRLDRSPAGAAAGFGAPVPLDRDYTAELLGFRCVQRNPVDVQNSRGRHELAVLGWLVGVAGVLEKFLHDVALYSTEEFGFLGLPDEFTTGSSIMPQKRNPDVIELARAACRELRGERMLVEQIATGLPSNYHRDLQRIKAPLLRALMLGDRLLTVVARLVPALQPVPERLRAACTPELWAAHEASRLASSDLGFRDAYRQVSEAILAGHFRPDRMPSPVVPDREAPAAALEEFRGWLSERRTEHERHERNLWNFLAERRDE
ncbi:MAG: lyase family protein [Gammaproteobacteria bacterium]